MGQERFFQASREFKAIGRLCWSYPTCQIRRLADASACRFADRHDDALFRKAVDGTELHSVAMFFYGTLPAATHDPNGSRGTKRFSVRALFLFGRRAQVWENVLAILCFATSHGHQNIYMLEGSRRSFLSTSDVMM